MGKKAMTLGRQMALKHAREVEELLEELGGRLQTTMRNRATGAEFRLWKLGETEVVVRLCERGEGIEVYVPLSNEVGMCELTNAIRALAAAEGGD